MYQCVIVNSQRLVTETAFVTLEKDKLPYRIDSRKPEYFYLPTKYHVSSIAQILPCFNRIILGSPNCRCVVVKPKKPKKKLTLELKEM